MNANIGHLVADAARATYGDEPQADNPPAGTHTFMPARYRVVEFNERQDHKTGFGIVRISLYGVRYRLALTWTHREGAQAVADALNAAAEFEPYEREAV